LPENPLHPIRLPPEVVLGGRCPGRLVGAGERRGGSESAGDVVDIGRIDERAGFRRDELWRAADPRCDDRAARGHRLEQGEAERLDQARLAEDVGAGEPRWYLGVGKTAFDRYARPALELFAERPVPDEGERA
jgi:hypothetical protein